MLKLYIKTRDALRALHTRESGQDAFEYLLVVGGVSVVIVGATVVLGTSAPAGVVTRVSSAIASIAMPG